MAELYVARELGAERATPVERSVWLDDGACYWHLYRYFEAAKVQRQEELVDLYADSEIEGYELDRLADELAAAQQDAQSRPDSWKVLTGWDPAPARENEVWRRLAKSDLLDLIARLCWLVEYARNHGLKLIVAGD